MRLYSYGWNASLQRMGARAPRKSNFSFFSYGALSIAQHYIARNIFNFDFFFDQENYEEEFYNYRACLKIWIFSEAWINFYSFFPLYLIEWNFFTTINHLNFRIGYFRGSLDKFYDFFSSCLIEWNFYYRLSKLVRIG